MSLKEAKQKFSELRTDIVFSSYSEQEEGVKSMIDLLKEYPMLCSDTLDMIEEESYSIDENCKEELLNNIIEIKPELSKDIIQRFNEFDVDMEYKLSKITDILQKRSDFAEQVIESVKDWGYNRDAALAEVVKNRPELLPKAKKVASDKSSIIQTFINGKDKLSEKDINLTMGEFSYKNFRKSYSLEEYDTRYAPAHQEKALDFIKKVVRGNPNNKEILKKCLLIIHSFDADKHTNRITNEILTLQPEFKEFAEQLNILKLQVPYFPKLEKIAGNHKSPFRYTTGSSDLTQLQYRVNVKTEKNNIITSSIKEINEKNKPIISKINEIDKAIGENTDLNEIIERFNSLAKQIKEDGCDVAVAKKLQEQRDKIGLKIRQAHQFYGKQIQQVPNLPDEISKVLNEIDFKEDTSSILISAITEIAEKTENEDVLKILMHKKEEAYGNWDYDNIKELEEIFANKGYIQRTLNKKYPDLSLEEQLIQAAYDVVNSGDEQKKKEFNEFILAEGEPRLAELDAKVMDYLHDNCTQNNLDKVNALRSFYGLKVELVTGNAVDADERTAVRKVFDRTWSSYERGKNTETGEPYYSESELEQAKKENQEQVEANPYYENAVSPAYRKYFEENDIYKIYQKGEHSEEERKYSTQDYFDSLIDKSSFKALRKHGLYNDMKVICDTLEKLQVEPEIAMQFNLKDLSDMVVNSHNTMEDRKVYNQETGEYMFTKSPHTDELEGSWRDPYYWHQYDDDDEYDDEWYSDDYENTDEDDNNGTSDEEKQYDEEGFEIIPVTDNYSERDEEVAARDAWWEDLADHNPKAVKHIGEAMARHGREDEAISGFWEAASYGTPGVGSRRDWRLLSATLHHAEAIQYGGNDDKNNFVGTARYYDSYGDTFAEDSIHIDYHKSFHRRDTPFDTLYVNPNAKSADDKLAIAEKTDDNAQKAFLITSFTDPHMHFYAGFRKKDQYTAPLYHMRNIEKEKQERVDKVEKSLEYLSRLGNALVSMSACISEALKTEEKIKVSKDRVAKTTTMKSPHSDEKTLRHSAVKIEPKGKQYE